MPWFITANFKETSNNINAQLTALLNFNNLTPNARLSWFNLHQLLQSQ